MYKGYAVYRFLDLDRNTIYIGMTNNAYRRIYKQHFTNRGHLPVECYSKTAKVDIIKLNNNLEAKGLEDYLIDKYRPKFNKRDKPKNPFSTDFGELGKIFADMENWRTFRILRDFNYIKTTRKLTAKENIVFYIILILSIGLSIFLYNKFK